MKQFMYSIVFLFGFNLNAQTDEMLIKETLSNYINGTSYNKIDLINKAFHENSNLYLDSDNGMRIVPISEYASWFKPNASRVFNGRIGTIISIDQFESIAIAKAEILIPKRNQQYIDMFMLKKLNGAWKIIGKTATSKTTNKQGDRILFVVSNAHYYGDTQLKTGNSFSEIVNAYHTFVEAGYTVDYVSPKGGAIPLAYINTSNPLEKTYLYDANFMYGLEHTRAPNTLNAKDYKAVHYIGGGSAMFEVPVNNAIQKLVMSVYEDYDGIISSVCHGTAGIVHLKTKDGKYLVEGKRVNGYPDVFEREDAAYFKTFPFLITKTIESHGGKFKYSPKNSVHVEEDGNLITGQNYLSSEYVARRIIERLQVNN